MSDALPCFHNRIDRGTRGLYDAHGARRLNTTPMSKRPDQIDPTAAEEYLAEARAQFLDARPANDRACARDAIPGAIPVDPGSGAELDDLFAALPREKVVIAYCEEPEHAASAAVARRARAFGLGDASFLAGGLVGWKEAGLPIEVTLAPPHLNATDAEGRKRDARYEMRSGADGTRLTARAPDPQAAFATIALACCDVLGAPGRAGSPDFEAIAVQAANRDALLLRWLQEIVAHAAASGHIFDGISIIGLSATELRAQLRVLEVAEWRHDIRFSSVIDAHEERDGTTVSAIADLAFVQTPRNVGT
jgi:rhodanese-related sulfurtransferase